MSQNITIPEELKAIVDAKTTFVTIPPAAATEPKPGKVSKLKSTPVIEPTEEEKKKTVELQMQLLIDETLGEINELTKLYKQYNKIEFTLRELKEFVHKASDEDSNYYSSTITITDSNRKEFKTQNPRLVESLVLALLDILYNKKTELGGKIAAISINK